MQRHQFLNLFYPPETIATPSGVKDGSASKGPSKSLTPDDINDLFNAPDEPEVKEPKTPVKEPKEAKKEEVDDEDEIHAEEGDEDDELELIEPEEDVEKLDLKADDDIADIEAPPRKKEILKEFPEIFKKFPFLEKVLYRDKMYNELFGSFDDAKELADRAEVFSQFENQLLAGNTEEVLRNVKETDEKAFNIIVDDYLTTLAKVDKESYFHVVGNLNKRLIMEMVQEANDTDNDDLKQAALLVNQFVFGNSKFTAPTNRVDRSKETDEKVSEAEKERLSFVQERFESSRDELQTQVDNTLRATISDYIDPRGTMSPYVKKNAVADAMKYLASAVAADPTVPKNLDRLWRTAFDSKFSRDSLGKIKSYYLSKAKGQLKQAILKARAEALKDSKQTPSKDREEVEEETPRQRKQMAPGKPSHTKGKIDGPRKGESTTDYFMRD